MEDHHLRQPIGLLHDPVTWYTITPAGEQVVQWDFQNNAPAFVPWPLFQKSHCATCSPACVILYHVTGSCKGPINAYYHFSFVLRNKKTPCNLDNLVSKVLSRGRVGEDPGNKVGNSP